MTLNREIWLPACTIRELILDEQIKMVARTMGSDHQAEEEEGK
jgi:hypothetical protein